MVIPEEISIVVVLLIALKSIYVFMREKAHQVVDLKEICLHALSFVFYLVSAVWIMYAQSWRYYISNVGFLIVAVIWVLCYFTS